jgi:hypothetical protein
MRKEMKRENETETNKIIEGRKRNRKEEYKKK